MKPIILALAGLILAAAPACAQQGSAQAGNAENGTLTVATTIISISSGLTPLEASTLFAASVPRCDDATPGAA